MSAQHAAIVTTDESGEMHLIDLVVDVHKPLLVITMFFLIARVEGL
jgi:hypothetical protein